MEGVELDSRKNWQPLGGSKWGSKWRIHTNLMGSLLVVVYNWRTSGILNYFHAFLDCNESSLYEATLNVYCTILQWHLMGVYL